VDADQGEGMSDPNDLAQLLRTRKLLVCVGSGGVGKTTTAAALAIGAARMGRRAVVVTIDPAKRLAQALGIAKMGNTPAPLDADLCAPGQAWATMLEAGEALDDFVAKVLPDPARRQRLLDNRLYQLVARQLAGTHEYMAVERLYALMNEGNFDLVVLDTPPTANALDFLEAPHRLSSFFSDKITRFFLRQRDEQRGLLQRLKDKAGDLALSVLGKALGDGFVEELVDFATAFQGLFAAIHERAIAADVILRAPSTGFVIVSAPDPVRTAEAAELAKTLRRLEVSPAAVVANRVYVASSSPAPDWTAVTAQHGEAVAVPLQSAWTTVSVMRARHAQGLLSLQGILGAERMHVVPELVEEIGSRAAVEHLVGTLLKQR
jgi:anion-transporting  ArsA/GET3 family ATPase